MDHFQSRKRGISDYDERGTKRARVPEPLMKLLIPFTMAGNVIGVGASYIKELRNTVKSRIGFSSSNEFFPGTDERVCLIRGHKDSTTAEQIQQITEVTCRIMNRMTKHESKKTRFLVTPRCAGILIGKAGATIKETQEQTGVKMDVCDNPEDKNKKERPVTITGTLQQRTDAIKKVIGLIAEDPSNMGNINLQYEGRSLDMGVYTQPFPSFDKEALKQRLLASGTLDTEQMKEQIVSALTGDDMMQNSGGGRTRPLRSTLELTIEVPFCMVGYIMGRKGEGIRDLTRRSNGARLEFAEYAGKEVKNGGMRTLTVTGSFNQVNTAHELVLDKVDEYMSN